MPYLCSAEAPKNACLRKRREAALHNEQGDVSCVPCVYAGDALSRKSCTKGAALKTATLMGCSVPLAVATAAVLLALSPLLEALSSRLCPLFRSATAPRQASRTLRNGGPRPPRGTETSVERTEQLATGQPL